jgi:hypothetical protein
MIFYRQPLTLLVYLHHQNSSIQYAVSAPDESRQIDFGESGVIHRGFLVIGYRRSFNDLSREAGKEI